MNRIPAHTIHMTKGLLYTEVTIWIRGKQIALTTVHREATKESPQVQSFIRNYFHLPKPKPHMRRRK